MKKKYAKNKKPAINIKDGDLKPEAYLDYDAFTEKGMIQLATELFAVSMESPVGGKNGLLATLKRASDKKQKDLIIYKPFNIEICFYPAFAKKLLGWLESEIEAKGN